MLSKMRTSNSCLPQLAGILNALGTAGQPVCGAASSAICNTDHAFIKNCTTVLQEKKTCGIIALFS